MASYYIYCAEEEVDEVFDAINASASLTAYKQQRKPNETHLPSKYILLTTDYFSDLGVMSELQKIALVRNKMKDGKVLVLKALEKKVCIGV